MFRVGARKRRYINHELFALWQKFVQRRIQQPDRYRQSFHRFEEADEVGSLHGKQLFERRTPILLVVGENHGTHVWNTILREEHVFGTAQPDALGTELARLDSVARNVSIGAHPNFAERLR